MLVLAGLLLGGGESAFARDKGKEDKKIAEQQLKTIRYEQALQAMDQQSFVLVADRLSIPRGQTFYVTGGDNFVLIDQGAGMLQLALCPDHLDQNGAGGITLAGKISDVSHKTNAKGEQVYRYQFNGRMTSVIDVALTPGDNYARASINGTGATTFWGRIIPAQEANVYKGKAYEPVPVGMFPSRPSASHRR